ncbi:MAG: hypothetical protein CL927_07855 [Deltaproteobacteria bacterium]|nr:hypothetical protein [Deltaproteobacteria bacterium]HCH62780.1 hypothetical protein [Deltaproteobacteria bacterium]
MLSPPLAASRVCALISRTIRSALALSALACSGTDAPDKIFEAPIDRDPLAVFPSAELMDSSGHIEIPEELLPFGDTPVPVERLRWRTGFSPVQTTVLDPGQPLDRTSLPPPIGSGAQDCVALVNLTTGERIPALVELDAWPENPEVPRLLVRPLNPMPPGHRIAVSVSASVRTIEGDAYAGPAWFQQARLGGAVEGGTADHYADLASTLEALGLPSPVLAVDFPVGDGRMPLHTVIDDLPDATRWEWLRVFNIDEDDSLPEGSWIQADGRFTTADWLVEDGIFALDEAGRPMRQGETEADLFLFIPDTVRAAEPNTAPVWIFGHGIFGHPRTYLADAEDPSGVISLAREAGAIVLGTTWRGLTRSDIPIAASVGGDFGRIPELTDKLVQGVANTTALARLIAHGELLSDPIFAGKADPNTLRYYGISLGGIEGATMFAVDDTIPHGVFHVGGSSWSTMLERSSNWRQFEQMMEYAVDSPSDRQLLYAASQLFWDAADPALYAEALSTRSVLWQGSVGDEQVANLTTDLLTAAVGAELLAPSPRVPDGFTETGGPLTGPAVAWYDPELGTPPMENRPAEVTGAHSVPRLWPGQHRQTLRFLDPVDPGIVEHLCGELPCTAQNPG